MTAKDRKPYPSACHLCGGKISEKLVTLMLPDPSGTTRLVHGVPAGVCDQCGEQYLRAEVTAAIDRILKSPPTRREDVPVWEFASSI